MIPIYDESPQVVDLGQKTQAWKAWREGLVTATDGVILLAATNKKSPWRLYQEKEGMIQPEDLSKNPYVRRGDRLEDMARKAVEKFLVGKLGIAEEDAAIIPCCFQRGALGASLDGILSVNGKRYVIEIKIPSEGNFETIESEGREADQYQEYYIQVQHQLLTSGADGGWLLFYRPSDSKKKISESLIDFEITPDEALFDELVLEATVFQSARAAGESPPANPELDVFSPEGEELEKWQERAQRYREEKAKQMDAQKVLDEHKEVCKDLEQEFIEQLGDFVSGEAAGVRVNHSWRKGTIDYPSAVKHVGEFIHTRLREAQSTETKEALAGVLRLLNDEHLEEYRKPGNASTRVTLKKKTDKTIN
jgi:putative phage-type endonuclease